MGKLVFDKTKMNMDLDYVHDDSSWAFSKRPHPDMIKTVCKWARKRDVSFCFDIRGDRFRDGVRVDLTIWHRNDAEIKAQYNDLITTLNLLTFDSEIPCPQKFIMCFEDSFSSARNMRVEGSPSEIQANIFKNLSQYGLKKDTNVSVISLSEGADMLWGNAQRLNDLRDSGAMLLWLEAN